MKILRTFFSGAGGKWEISGPLSMNLAPPPGSKDSDYYAISDEVVAKSPAIFGTTSFLLGQSIVPVVAHLHPEKKLLCIGTGFFISCTGLLITAAHVVTDPIDRDYGGNLSDAGYEWDESRMALGVLLPMNPLLRPGGFQFYPLDWTGILAEKAESPLPFAGIDLKLTTDIAICKVPAKPNGEPHQPLAIVQPRMRGTGMQVGSETLAIGYADMADEIEIKDGALQGDFQFRLFASKGKITEQFPDNLTTKGATTPGPCFSCSAVATAGMSGGPIFDHEQIYVHGVVSKGIKDSGGHAPHSNGSMLAGSMRIPIRTMNDSTLLDLLAAGTEGMPNMSVPGA